MATDTISLLIRRPDGEELRYDLDPGVYTIGSDNSNRIALPGSGIAWRHAILSLTGDGLWIEDLNSPGGTLVDGRRVRGREAVQPAAVIRPRSIV